MKTIKVNKYNPNGQEKLNRLVKFATKLTGRIMFDNPHKWNEPKHRKINWDKDGNPWVRFEKGRYWVTGATVSWWISEYEHKPSFSICFEVG